MKVNSKISLYAMIFQAAPFATLKGSRVGLMVVIVNSPGEYITSSLEAQQKVEYL